MNQAFAQSMIDLIKNGGNPEQLVIAYLRGMGSPIGDNLATMVQSKDNTGIENFARNICAQYNLDFDKEFNSFKNNLKL